MWKIIHAALPTCSDHSINKNTTLNIHGKKITNSQLIANHYNEFFCNTELTLAKLFSKNKSNSFKKFLHNCTFLSVYLDVPNHSIIINTIFSINMNKAVGHDNLYSFPLNSLNCHYSVPAFFHRIQFYQ